MSLPTPRLSRVRLYFREEFVQMRRLLLTAATLLVLGATMIAAAPASAAETPVLLGPEETSTALFVAGDINRLSTPRTQNDQLGGTEELVLEKVLQQMYIDNPAILPENAAYEIELLKSLMFCPQAPTQASLGVMAGNQRILAILAALESGGYCSPAVNLSEAAPETKLALTHLAGVALASSSDIFAKAESPKYFEPLADERNNLIYSSFAPATVLRATRALAARNGFFGVARNLVWEEASQENVFAGARELIFESKVLESSHSMFSLLNIIAIGDGVLYATPGELADLFSEGQANAQAQTCAHGSGQEKLSPETIPGVPPLTCNGGALYEASKATPRPESEWPGRLTEVRTIAKQRAAIVAEERALMAASAELLRPSEQTAAQVEQATGQAQTQITEDENEYAKYEAEQKTRNIIKGSLKIIGEIFGSIVSFATKSPSEGVNGLISAGFEIYALVEEGLNKPPAGPQEIALKDMTALSNQLSGFQQYTQEAFRALDTQVAQLNGQLAQDTYELKLELGSLAEKMEFEQQTIFELEDEVQTLFSTQAKAELQTTIADSVGWFGRTGEVLSSSKLQESFVGLQKYATEIANGALVNSETQPYTFEGADVQLTSKRTGEPVELNEAITYLAHFPVEKGWETTAIPPTLPNTTFWSEGARADAQLMLENASRVSAANKAGLKSLENEGLTLEKAQNPWSEHSGGEHSASGNAILDHVLQKFEQAAAGEGVEGKRSVTDLLEEGSEKSFYSGLKTHTGVAGNPTNVNLWGGAEQETSAATIENQHYPALSSFDALNAELTCLPWWLLTGIRLGIVGARKSGDEWEVSFGGFPPFEECYEVKLYKRGATNATIEAGVEKLAPFYKAAFRPVIDRGIAVLQKEAYEAALEELKKEDGPSNRLAGARALVQSYVKLGLPQALSSDPVLETDVEGTGAQFLDPEPATPRPVPEELTALVRSWSERVEAAVPTLPPFGAPEIPEPAVLEEHLIQEVAKRSSAWAGEVAKTVKPYIEGDAPEFSESGGQAVSEQSPIVESTINRLRLTRDLLTESSAPGAETLAATNIGATEASLNGEVSPNGAEVESCEFEYGSSEPHGHTVACSTIPKASENGALVSAQVTNWMPAGGSFHERLVVKTWGGTTYGEDVKVQLAQSASSKDGPVLASTPTSGATIELKLEEPPPAHPGLPAGADTPVGLLSLIIGHVAAGSSVPVRIELPTSAPTALYMLAHVSGGGEEYKEVPRSLYTITGNVINVTLIDGGVDDLDGQANGRIEAGLVPLAAGAAPTGPSVATTGAAVGIRTATLEGTVNPNGKGVTSCQFTVEEISAGFPTGQSETAPCSVGPGSGSEPVAVTALATELSPGTEYRFSLAASNASGSATSEPPSTFTTKALPGPTVVTGEVTNIKKRTAVLFGTVNPNGVGVSRCWANIQEVVVKVEGGIEKLEPGKEKPVAYSCIEGVGTGHSPVSVLVNARKLLVGTKYTYQFFAENGDGTVGEGATSQPFQTLAKRIRKK